MYPDRIEWARKGLLSTGAKAGLAMATGGMSYLATGVRGKREGESIPIRSISHVGRRTHRFQDYVVLSTSGGEIEMRVSRAEADQLGDLINKLIAEAHSPVAHHAAPMAVPVPVHGGPSLEDLASAYEAGIITEEEFAAAKRKVLGL